MPTARKSASRKAPGISSAGTRAKRRSRPTTASFPTTKSHIHKGVTFVDETSPGKQVAIVGAPDKPRR